MMTSSKISLIFALFAFASVALAANPQCIRNVEGYIYNLCPLETPANFSVATSDWKATYTFAIAKPNAPKCGNGAASAWFSAFYGPSKGSDDGGCLEISAPVFKLFQKEKKVYGLMINYYSEEYNKRYALKIICDPIGSRDGNTEWNFEDIANDGTLTVTGSSYYGCAVGKNYFEI